MSLMAVESPSSNLALKAATYFATLNPLAEKINEDIEAIRNRFAEHWLDLKPNERNSILDESLIKQDIFLKYFDNFSSRSNSTESLNRSGYRYDGKNLRTFSSIKTGRKLIQDETIGKFRDEHSAPFCWRTKSQINLRLYDPEEIEDTGMSVNYNKLLSAKLAQEAAKKAATKSPPMKPEVRVEQIESNISYNKIRNDDEAGESFLSKFIAKGNNIFSSSGANKDLLDEEETLVSNISLSMSAQHSEESEEEIHTEKSLEFKSLLEDSKGFDFLNNW